MTLEEPFNLPEFGLVTLWTRGVGGICAFLTFSGHNSFHSLPVLRKPIPNVITYWGGNNWVLCQAQGCCKMSYAAVALGLCPGCLSSPTADLHLQAPHFLDWATGHSTLIMFKKTPGTGLPPPLGRFQAMWPEPLWLKVWSAPSLCTQVSSSNRWGFCCLFLCSDLH